jgi:hypothetical protein
VPEIQLSYGLLSGTGRSGFRSAPHIPIRPCCPVASVIFDNVDVGIRRVAEMPSHFRK